MVKMRPPSFDPSVWAGLVQTLEPPSGNTPEWWIAIVLTLAGTTLTATGLMLQKDSHNKDRDAKSPDAEASSMIGVLYFLSPRWLAGMSVFLAGHLFCWMGLALGTQVVLSCLNVWSVVITFVFAPMMLKETVCWKKVGSAVIIIIGAIVVIVFGPRAHKPYTIKVFVKNLDNHFFLWFSGFSASLLVFLALKAWCTTSRPRLPMACYTLASAMLGWYSVLSSKCVAGLLFTSWHYKDSQFGIWITWVVIVAMLFFAVSNIHLMNVALQNGDAVIVVPIYESLSVLGQVFLGGIFFDEFGELHGGNQVSFWIGVTCIIAGILLMTGPSGYEEFLHSVGMAATGSLADPQASPQTEGPDGKEKMEKEEKEEKEEVLAGGQAACAVQDARC